VYSELVVFEWACVSGDALPTKAVYIGLANKVARTVVLFNIKAVAFLGHIGPFWVESRISTGPQ
jgi:hypothetical protein